MDRRLIARGGRRRARRVRRSVAWLLLVAAVTLLHLVATVEIAERMTQFDLAHAMPPRIVVAYVRSIEPEPAVAAPAAPPPIALRPYSAPCGPFSTSICWMSLSS